MPDPIMTLEAFAALAREELLRLRKAEGSGIGGLGSDWMSYVAGMRAALQWAEAATSGAQSMTPIEGAIDMLRRNIAALEGR